MTRRNQLNFNNLLKGVFVLAGDRTSEKLLSEVSNELDLSEYVLIDMYALSRSQYKDEYSLLEKYLNNGRYSKIQRLRRGCQLIPVSLDTMEFSRLNGLGRSIYLFSHDNFLKLEKNVKEYSVKIHRRDRN